MTAAAWADRTPSRRCDWIDQLRGWAVIVMIEVHTVNTWLRAGLRPDWLNYLNGLVAPSFTMAAGFSLVLSTYRPDGTVRPFWPGTAKRLGFILLCAYALHAPGFTLADWTVLSTTQKLRELFKIDVLQCIVYSLLILHALARLVRNPRTFAFLALGLAVFIPLVSPQLWATGVGDGLWLPIRGLFNGNPDRGVQALFPLFPWFAFPAIGAFLGGIYRWMRVEAEQGRARWSEGRFLAFLALAGALLAVWGRTAQHAWLWGGRWVQENGVWMLHSRVGVFTYAELSRLSNTTLPSVADRTGFILIAGAAMGAVELLRPRWRGPNPVEAASRESLLLYMLHLNLIFGLLLTPPVVRLTGWDWHALGWGGTLAIAGGLIAFNLLVGVWWQKVRTVPDRMRTLQRRALAVLAVWFLVGGWITFAHFLRSPELATEPYPFLNAARERKGLQPTPDGLCRDPQEYFREAARRHIRLDPADRARITAQILARREPG